jgi:hypothetical protein
VGSDLVEETDDLQRRWHLYTSSEKVAPVYLFREGGTCIPLQRRWHLYTSSEKVAPVYLFGEGGTCIPLRRRWHLYTSSEKVAPVYLFREGGTCIPLRRRWHLYTKQNLAEVSNPTQNQKPIFHSEVVFACKVKIFQENHTSVISVSTTVVPTSGPDDS